MERRPGSGRTHGLKAQTSQQVLGREEEEIPTDHCCLSRCNRCNECTKCIHYSFFFRWKRISLSIQWNTHNIIKSGGRVMERPWSAGCRVPQILNHQDSSLLLWWMCAGTPRIERNPLICRPEDRVQYGCSGLAPKKKKKKMQINMWTQTRRVKYVRY